MGDPVRAHGPVLEDPWCQASTCMQAGSTGTQSPCPDLTLSCSSLGLTSSGVQSTWDPPAAVRAGDVLRHFREMTDFNELIKERPVVSAEEEPLP